jgi:hypothetical protein
MSDYLIMVNVTHTNFGRTVTLLDYLNNVPITGTMNLTPGDRVAWTVQTYIGNNKCALPFEVAFTDSDNGVPRPNTSFFGTSSISVPAGGTSHFLPVLALQQKIEYSITVPGLGKILDPEMQTGQDPSSQDPDTELTFWTVTWNTDNNTVWFQANSGVLTEFAAGLKIGVGDKIAFNTTSAMGPMPPIIVAFQVNPLNRWASPFFAQIGTVPANGPTNPIPPLTVLDSLDPAGSTFSFNIESEVSSSPACVFVLG